MPNVVFNGNNGANPDRPVSQPIQGASAGAPLGTDPAYHMTEVTPVLTETKASSKATSALAAGQDYAVRNATVTADTVTDPSQVNFTAAESTLRFNEGKTVNLWIKYESRANVDFHWKWTVNTTGLSFEENHHETTAGVHTYYMPMLLPLDEASSADKPAKFTITFGAKTGSVVVIPPDELTASINFTIVNVPTTVITYGNEGGAYMAWEDLLTNSDYDYNDFVGALYAKESRRTSDNKVVQVSFTVKAIARGAGYNSDWQFNLDSAFPGAACTAYIQQYKYNGVTEGSLRVWKSTDGVSIPVLVSNNTDALPPPADDSFATNVHANTTWVNGDYALVTIVFNSPLAPNSYTPIPYKPKLRVIAGSSSVYIIGLWTKRGDPVDSNGRPLGFIIPDDFAWPMESVTIWTGYPRFNNWVTWIGNGSGSEPKWWLDTPVYGTSGSPNVYKPSLFKGSAPALPISFPKP